MNSKFVRYDATVVLSGIYLDSSVPYERVNPNSSCLAGKCEIQPQIEPQARRTCNAKCIFGYIWIPPSYVWTGICTMDITTHVSNLSNENANNNVLP